LESLLYGDGLASDFIFYRSMFLLLGCILNGTSYSYIMNLLLILVLYHVHIFSLICFYFQTNFLLACGKISVILESNSPTN
jgi:hypothetical protein